MLRPVPHDGRTHSHPQVLRVGGGGGALSGEKPTDTILSTILPGLDAISPWIGCYIFLDWILYLPGLDAISPWIGYYISLDWMLYLPGLDAIFPWIGYYIFLDLSRSWVLFQGSVFSKFSLNPCMPKLLRKNYESAINKLSKPC